MRAPANGTVSVYRATDENDYVDTVDANVSAVLANVPIRITEQTKRVTTRDDPTPRIVRWLVARVEQGTDIRDGDRLESEQTGAFYLVDSTAEAGDGVLGEDFRLDLRRIA